MKKRIFSLLLCLVMLAGILPARQLTSTVSAKAPEVQEITDIVVRTNADGSVKVSFSGVPTAEYYSVSFGSSGRSIYVTDEAQNAGTFTEVFSPAVFYDFGHGQRYCKTYRARVYARNFYGETIADGYSDNFKSPYERYIDVPRKSYLSSTGLFLFDPVEGAKSYTVTCSYHGKQLKSIETTSPFMDISDIAREGDTYDFTITVYPTDSRRILPSRLTVEEKFTSETKLAGTVYINDDKSLAYDWYLGYLHTHTDTPLTVQWQRYVPGEDDASWVNITESQKKDYSLTELRVVVTAGGHTGSVESQHNSYTDPAHPYIATDYKGLRAVFNQCRDKNKTAYIRLGCDIEATGSYLVSNGGQVDLDLCGYNLSYVGGTRAFIRSGNGGGEDDARITIRDSRRYDSKKGAWVDGGISYICDSFEEVPYGREQYYDHVYTAGQKMYKGNVNCIFTGNITVLGGVFANYSYDLAHIVDPWTPINDYVYGEYPSSHYYGLKMYGGTFESRYPIRLRYSEDDREYGIYGGTIRSKGTTAISIFAGSIEYGESYFPAIRNCEIINASGNSQSKVLTFSYNKYQSLTEETVYENFSKCFIPETKAYIDGVKQSAVTAGTSFNGSTTISGPTYTNKYEIKTEITVNRLDFNITEPAVNQSPDYTVTGSESDLYDAKLYWYYEATPNHFEEMPENHLFHSGIYYEAVIMLQPKDGVNISEVKGSVTVGSKQADKYGLMFIVYYYINDQFRDIWIGSTHVGVKSKGDVLGDGGSVQLYEPGEYIPSNDDIAYGFKTSDFADKPVLVLNNFNLDRADYHPDENDPAQIYLGEDVFVLLQGNNSLYHMTDADGIHIGNERSLRFIGDGSLTADLDQCDYNALSGWGAKVYFSEAVNVTLKGIYGINLVSGHDPGEQSMVLVENDAFLTCGAYPTSITMANPEPHYYNALYCEHLYLHDAGAIICDAPSKGEAMYTGGTSFSNDWYDILVLAYGEYGIAPYEPYEGINIGGDNEALYHYVSIYPRQALLDWLRVSVPEPKAGDPITYTASVPAGRGYQVEAYDGTTWKDGVSWSCNGTALRADTAYSFEAGNRYTVYVSLVPTDARYAFAEFQETGGAINGRNANLRFYNPDNYAVYYTFTVSDDSCAVSGSVTSYGNETDSIRLELIPEGESEPAYDTVVTGKNTNYTINGVAVGAYILRVSKTNHVTREYSVIVSHSSVEQDVKIHLLGDVTGDGKITVLDAARANSHAKGVSLLSGYELLCADTAKNDGLVTTVDAARINSHAKGVSKLW